MKHFSCTYCRKDPVGGAVGKRGRKLDGTYWWKRLEAGPPVKVGGKLKETPNDRGAS